MQNVSNKQSANVIFSGILIGLLCIPITKCSGLTGPTSYEDLAMALNPESIETAGYNKD